VVNRFDICWVDNAIGVNPSLDEVVLEQQLVLGLPLPLFFVADAVAGQQSAADIARLDPPALDGLVDVVASLVLGGVVNAGLGVGETVMKVPPGRRWAATQGYRGRDGAPRPEPGSPRSRRAAEGAATASREYAGLLASAFSDRGRQRWSGCLLAVERACCACGSNLRCRATTTVGMPFKLRRPWRGRPQGGVPSEPHRVSI
jgi:hypothetical protein